MKKILFAMLLANSCFAQNNNKILTYLALGDSYTIGESVSESERYPVILASMLNQNGIKVSSPKIIATTGWTTDELKLGIKKENIEGKTYDLVSLLIGVNNQYRGRDPEQYRKDFISLLEDAIRFSGNNPKNVFVVSIPDWGVSPFGKKSDKPNISKNIDLFNAINKEETEKKGVLYMDITPISRLADTDISLIADDGLHPSGKMYRLWAEKILPELLKNLR